MQVREFIRQFVDTFRDVGAGSDGWRAAARHLEINHQTLIYRAKKSQMISQFARLLEPMRKRLNVSKSAAWDILTKKEE